MSRARRGERGLTLLEVLVATAITAMAIAGLLASISTSIRNASRVTDADRAAMLAKTKMDELLAEPVLPRNVPLSGQFPERVTGGKPMGWRANASLFDRPPGASVSWWALERISLRVVWEYNGEERSFPLEAYRRTRIRESDVAGPVPPQGAVPR